MVNTFTLTHFHVLSYKELTNTYSDPEQKKKWIKWKNTQKNMCKNPIPWNPWKYLNLLKIHGEADSMVKERCWNNGQCVFEELYFSEACCLIK